MTKQTDSISITQLSKLGYMPPPTVLTLANPYFHAAGLDFANVPGMALSLQPHEVWQLNVLLIFLADANGYSFQLAGDNIDVFKAFSANPATSTIHRAPVTYRYDWARDGVLPAGDPLQVSERLDLVARVYTGSTPQTMRLQARKNDTLPGGDWQLAEAQIIAQRIA